MIRYDDYFALSNNFLEHGVEIIVGAPQALLEASVGAPADVGEAKRRSGVDTVVRAGVLPVAHCGCQLFPQSAVMPAAFAHGHTAFVGVDARWMWNGVQLRGEWITGRPFDGTTTKGGYLDAFVHRVGMGPVTAVARIERLDYDTIPRFALFARRATVGARLRLPRGFTAQATVDHQWRQPIQRDPTTLGLAFTLLIAARCRSSASVSRASRNCLASPHGGPVDRRWPHRRRLARGVAVAATTVATDQSLARASENMRTAQSAFARLVENAQAIGGRQTRLITALPVFRAHMTDARLAADIATIAAMADDYRRQLQAQFTIVTDRHGAWTGNPGWPAGGPPAAVITGIREALAGRSSSGRTAILGRVFLVVSEPAQFAEENLGSMTVGFALDDEVAADLASVTQWP